MRKIRHSQLALALDTLESKREPSSSRCLAVLPAVLWILYRARIGIQVVPQSGTAEEPLCGRIELFAGRPQGATSTSPQDTRVLPLIGHVGAVDEVGLWSRLPEEIVLRAWGLRQRAHEISDRVRRKGTDLSARLEGTITALRTAVEALDWAEGSRE